MIKVFKPLSKEASGGQLADWLYNYLTKAVKDNGIEWLTPMPSTRGIKYPEDKILEDTLQLRPVVFAQPGRIEGNVITVAVSSQEGTYDVICRAKLFAPAEKVGEVTQAATHFMSHFLWAHEVPWILEFEVPTRMRYCRRKYRLEYRDESLYWIAEGKEYLAVSSVTAESASRYMGDIRTVMSTYELEEEV